MHAEANWETTESLLAIMLSNIKYISLNKYLCILLVCGIWIVKFDEYGPGPMVTAVTMDS